MSAETGEDAVARGFGVGRGVEQTEGTGQAWHRGDDRSWILLNNRATVPGPSECPARPAARFVEHAGWRGPPVCPLACARRCRPACRPGGRSNLRHGVVAFVPTRFLFGRSRPSPSRSLHGQARHPGRCPPPRHPARRRLEEHRAPAHGRGRPRRRRDHDPQHPGPQGRRHVLERDPRDGLQGDVGAGRRPGHAGDDHHRRLRTSTTSRRRTTWSSRCGPRSTCWARCSAAVARRACRCPAAAPGARARSTCTSRAWRRSAPRSREEGGYVIAEAPGGRLTGGRMRFEPVSVGATINVMLAAVTAQGESVLENCAAEPDVVVFGEMLQAMGAQIEGLGTDTITVQGVETMNPVDVHELPRPHRTGHLHDRRRHGDADRRGRSASRAPTPSTSGRPSPNDFRETGVPFTFKGDVVEVTGVDTIRPVSIETAPVPGLRDRPPGPVDGHDDAGRRPVDGPRHGLHRPVQARPRAAPPGRRPPGGRRHGPRRGQHQQRCPARRS